MASRRIYIGTSIGTIIALFSALWAIGLQITGSDDICLGTIEDPCISYGRIYNPTPYNIDIYNRNGVLLNFSPEIEHYELYFKDGRIKTGKYPGWRFTNFTNATKPRKDRIYVHRFAAYSYQEYMLVGYKKSPNDVVKWSLGIGNELLDPVWNVFNGSNSTCFIVLNGSTATNVSYNSNVLNFSMFISGTYVGWINTSTGSNTSTGQIYMEVVGEEVWYTSVDDGILYTKNRLNNTLIKSCQLSYGSIRGLASNESPFNSTLDDFWILDALGSDGKIKHYNRSCDNFENITVNNRGYTFYGLAVINSTDFAVLLNDNTCTNGINYIVDYNKTGNYTSNFSIATFSILGWGIDYFENHYIVGNGCSNALNVTIISTNGSIVEAVNWSAVNIYNIASYISNSSILLGDRLYNGTRWFVEMNKTYPHNVSLYVGGRNGTKAFQSGRLLPSTFVNVVPNLINQNASCGVGNCTIELYFESPDQANITCTKLEGYFDEQSGMRGWLNQIGKDTLYEYDTVELNVNLTRYDGQTYCIDFDYEGYGINFTCTTGSYNFSARLNNTYQDKFSDNTKELNISLRNQTKSCCTRYENQSELNNNNDGIELGKGGGSSKRGVFYLINHTDFIGNITYWIYSQANNGILKDGVSVSYSPNMSISFQIQENNFQYNKDGGTIIATKCNLTMNTSLWNTVIFNQEVDNTKFISLHIFIDHNCDGIESATTNNENFITDYNTSGYFLFDYSVGGIWQDNTTRKDPTINWYIGGISKFNKSNVTFNIDHGAILQDISLNLTGYLNVTYPKNIRFNVGSNLTWPLILEGVLIGNQIWADHFTNNKSTEIIDFPVATTIARNIELINNKTIVNATINFSGIRTYTAVEKMEIDDGRLATPMGENLSLSETKTTNRFSFRMNDVNAGLTNCGVMNITKRVNITLTTGNFSNISNNWNDCNYSVINITAGEDYLFFVNGTGSIPQFKFSGNEYPKGNICYGGNFSTCITGTDMTFRLYTLESPENLTVDIGLDTIIDYNFTQVLDTTVREIQLNISLLENLTDNSSFCSGLICRIPLGFALQKGGQLNITFINITQDKINPIKLPIKPIQDLMNDSKGDDDLDATIFIAAEREGKVSINNLRVRYLGSKNITVFATWGGNATRNSSNISMEVMIRYSRFNLTPAFSSMQFFPKTVNSSNVSPYGQTNNISFWNITSKGYSTPIDVSVLLNQTINGSCVDITASTTFNSSNTTLLNTSNQTFFTNIGFNEIKQLWFFANLNQCNSTAYRFFRFKAELRTCCRKCLGCW